MNTVDKCLTVASMDNQKNGTLTDQCLAKSSGEPMDQSTGESKHVAPDQKGVRKNYGKKAWLKQLLAQGDLFKARRSARKKTKYDPSDFILTPHFRKRKDQVAAKEKGKKNVSLTKKKHLLKKCTNKEDESDEMDNEAGSCDVKPKVEPMCQESETKQAQDLKEDLAIIKDDQILPTPPRSSNSMLKDQCYLCSSHIDVNNVEDTLSCFLCLNIAHKNCVNGDQFYKSLKQWRCDQCLPYNPIHCSLCNKDYIQKGKAMAMCDACQECYHLECHHPQITLPIPSSWICSYCPRITLIDTLIGGREDLKSTVGTHAYSVPTKAANSETIDITEPQQTSPEKEVKNTDFVLKNPIEIKREPMEEMGWAQHRPEDPIPLVDDWTPKQVADYFSDRFGMVVGNAFLAQEIDGKSLKLMSRGDVMMQLGLNLGMALKVLYYVRKIQLRTNLFQKLWA